MRTPLFLATLFAATLVGGAALASPSSHGGVDRLRARGDMVDKSYRVSTERHTSPQSAHDVSAPARPAPDHASPRVACAEMSPDCPQHASTRGGGGEGTAGRPERAARAPAFLDKVLGSDRTNFNEAGESQGMSSHAVQRAWSHAGGAAAGAAVSLPLAHQQQHARAGEQASQNRASCNEAGECTMSSKDSKKEWAYRSVKAGTWRGPEAQQPAAAAPVAAPVKTAQVVTTGRPASKAETPKHDGPG